MVLLGTGIPFPDPAASGPATAVVVGARVFLFDAGPGVMRQLTAADLRPDQLEAVFITHLHTDHTLGYPDVIFTSWNRGRRAPLRVYGPQGLGAMTEHLLAAYSADIAIRERGMQRLPANGYQVTATEVHPGVVYDSGGVRVTAVPVQHGEWAAAFGYRIDAPGRSVVVSGDTRPNKALTTAAAGVDVLVHSVYYWEEPNGPPPPAYLKYYHTSAYELGQVAAQARPRLLVLTHLVGARDAAWVDRVRAGGYTGPVVVGQDLGRY